MQVYRSIDKSCARLTNILENYLNSLFHYSNEENALGILLKECAKHDKTKAGKVMSLTGKSLSQSSHQRIRLYMPLMRIYQEMETFHSRAVSDTTETVDKLEDKRSQYRASLLWMKNISEKLDPDIYRQLDKFRRVQNQVRTDKKLFDNIQMDVVQKIDLLMASRCNLFNQIIAPYQALLLETFEKNHNNYKSVEELIKKEDLYEFEFQVLKQLNPLKISDDDSPRHELVEISETNNGGADANDNNSNNNNETIDNLIELFESQEASGSSRPDERGEMNLIDVTLDERDEEDQEWEEEVRSAAAPADTMAMLESLFGGNSEEQKKGSC